MENAEGIAKAVEAEPAIVAKGEGENTQVVLRGRKEGKAKRS